MADNRSYVYRRLRQELGLTPAQAAGAVGGLGGESGRTLDPNAVNPSSGALGIGQWLGGRARGVRKGDVRQQTNHLIAELKGPERGALNRLRGARNIHDATRAWVESFERPSAAEIASSMPARLGYARDAFNAFHGITGGGSTGGGATAPARPSISGGSTRTTTTITPGVDNRVARAALISSFLEDHNADPVNFAVQANALKDIAPTTTSKTIRLPGTGSPRSSGRAAAVSPSGVTGRVHFAPGADRPGVSTQPIVKSFIAQVAGHAQRPIMIGTGTNHNRMTTSGNVSDHWTGHAADLPQPVDSRQGDMVAAHALQVAGIPWSQAVHMAQRGGVFNVTPASGPYKGHRIQVLWKTNVGGNHHNHVHVGIQ